MATPVEATAAGAVASSCLACCCYQFDKYIVQADKNVSDLKFVVEKLDAIVTHVNNKVSRNQLGSSANVAENWLRRSAAVSSASEKLSQEIGVMCCPRLNFWSRYIVGKRAFREIEKANRLIEEGGKLKASTASLLLPQGGGAVQEKQIETKLVGMDPYLKTALHYIDDNKVGIVGISGMGGVGKTTLLRKIHTEFLPGKERSKYFNEIMWAVVSKKFNVEDGETATQPSDMIGRELGFYLDLQSDIGRELNLCLDPEPDSITRESLEQRARPINDYLNGRSFLLFLDDLWKPLEFKLIGIPDPTTNSGGSSSRKQKVVLTSRSEIVCGHMRAANALINVRCLEDNDAWELFKSEATEQTIASHQDIENLARDVMKECQGLPLALNTIGKALSTKVGDPRPWQAALAKLKEARYVDIPGMEKENAAMLYRLKISYDYLPSQSHMDCFLSCCLWPEDYSIEIEKLIECCLGLGIIPEPSGMDACRVIISNLKQVHLLEPGDDATTEVKMHDTIRDMSQWISWGCGKTKNKWLVKAGDRIQTAQTVSSYWHLEDSMSMERLSLMNNIIEALPSEGISELSKLKVLMLQHNTPLRVVPGSFLQCAPALTYLDLSNTGIQELPAEVKFLLGLEYLNLSESHIKKLPEELSSLTELRYIYLSSTNYLTSVPYGIISNLMKLQALDVYQSKYTSWDEARVTVGNATPESAGENGNCSCLEELKARETSLKRLGITLDKAVALRNLARCELVGIKRLCLKIAHLPTPSLHLLPSSVNKLLGSFDMLKSLEEFMLSTSQVLKEVIIDGGSDGSNQICLPALHKLKLVSLYTLEQIRFHGISANDFLPNLRSVKIFHCYKVKNVNWLLRLPQLSHLELQFCKAIETLIINDDTVKEHPINNENEVEVEQTMDPVFPVLKTLNIHSLGSLTSLGSGASVNFFPALEILEITQCKNLTRLDIHPQRNLREIRCGEKWWHDLQWDDNSIKQETLLPYFRASKLKRNASQKMRR